jgi:hypothetical protein
MSIPDKQQRKLALEQAKQKLAKRKTDLNNIAQLRNNRNNLGNDFGKKVMEETKEMITNLSKQPDINEQKNKSSNYPGLPGRRIELTVVTNLNNLFIAHKDQEKYYKEVQTDCQEIAYDAEIFNDNTNEQEMMKVLSAFASNEAKAWPPKSKK